MEICWEKKSGAGGVWGTICNTQWSSAHTEVLCRSLGFEADGNDLTVKMIIVPFNL